jgi:hypothetical protein
MKMLPAIDRSFIKSTDENKLEWHNRTIPIAAAIDVAEEDYVSDYGADIEVFSKAASAQQHVFISIIGVPIQLSIITNTSIQKNSYFSQSILIHLYEYLDRKWWTSTSEIFPLRIHFLRHDLSRMIVYLHFFTTESTIYGLLTEGIPYENVG